MMRWLTLALNYAAFPAAMVLLIAGQPWWLALLSLMIPHALWLWATLVPSCSWWGPVFRRLPTAEKAVWLTIDDGPDPWDTPVLLDLLDQHRAKASFFVIGEKAERHDDLIRDIASRGHELGNHTWFHPAGAFWFLGRGRTIIEIKKCSGIIRRLVPETSLRWFRAPAGMRNSQTHPVLKEQGLRLAGWTVRGRDGVSADKDAILRRLKRGIRPGAVILMHEGRLDLDGKRLAPQVLGELLRWLDENGYRCVLPASQPA